MVDDLTRTAASLKLDANQQAAFDAAVETIRQRQAARQAAPQQGGNTLFGGRGRGSRSRGGASGADRKSVGSGKRGAVRVGLGGRRVINKKITIENDSDTHN